ncbi:MAG: hypothetical protein L3K09_02550 [Thermoplasmata archaeon]|nr:hypothetical protein [Thermoplasmata archaeon]
MPSAPRTKTGEPPDGFEVQRKLALGLHPILDAFPGLDRLPTARRQEHDAGIRKRLFAETSVMLVADDLWMYVAPHDLPKGLRRRWKPVVSPGTDTIVIGESHLRESPALILFLDIFHELCHIRQRHAGMELFDRNESYVRRPTEVEAYRFVVVEARKLGVSDEVLREYLKVEWITDAEYLELLNELEVPAK